MDVLIVSPTIAMSSRLSISELPLHAEVDSQESHSELTGDMKKQHLPTSMDTSRITSLALTEKQETLVSRVQASSHLNNDTDPATGITEAFTSISISPPTPEGQHPSQELTLGPSAPTQQLQQQQLSLNRENDIASAISVPSTSGTLVSNHPVPSTATLAPAHSTLSNTTTGHTIAPTPACFDRQSFKTVFQDLVNQTEQFETLNDQVLDAMTEFDETRLGLRPAALSGTGWSSDPDNLEEARHRIAKAVTDQVVSAWPSLSMSAPWTTTSGHSSEKNAGEYQQQQQGQERAAATHDAKLLKQRIKAVNQLKNATVAFWSAQNHFHERAQLVLDIFQDPTELEREEGLRILRSRHLNNLLSCSPTPNQIEELSAKFKADQEALEKMMAPMHTVLLSIVVALGETERAVLSSNNTVNSEDQETTSPSLGRRLMQMGRVKRQAFKRMLQSW
ncbi:hypothetical protein EMPS_03222 [Entomortierella parvispora]|uniref:Uncharacterized protein n=1 Tax=Entomortierella parvispora TaxID=205924 RepID=A0A9P3H6D3_9FUNG|nr:hypothetical protein EMPS_03222 [Entomortierella parvispora]